MTNLSPSAFHKTRAHEWLRGRTMDDPVTTMGIQVFATSSGWQQLVTLCR